MQNSDLKKLFNEERTNIKKKLKTAEITTSQLIKRALTIIIN